MIEIKNLSVAFPRSPRVLDSANLSVPDGLNTMVIGESGSGKSVMLSAILRILPENAKVSGSVLYDGTDLLRLPENSLNEFRGRKLAYIPQGSGNSLNPLLKVGFQIAEPLMEFGGLSKSAALSKAAEWLEKLNIENAQEIACAYPHMLSGGMKQRVLIAMGAAGGASTLLADEPTKGLDEENTQRVIEVFRELKGKTLLCVSHDLSFVREMADRVCVMYAAQQVECSKKASFFDQPLHPYSQLLLQALPENGMKTQVGFALPHKHYGAEGCHFRVHCPFSCEKCRELPPMVEIDDRKVRCWKYAD